MHPAKKHTAGVLQHYLEEEIKAGNVRKTVQDDLTLYVYTEQCQNDRRWNEFNICARGIVFNSKHEIVALPFPKFFNYGEGEHVSIPDLPFEVFDKLDGSLIIAYNYAGQWFCNTKGSFQSDQAKWAKKWLDRHSQALCEDYTYLFEAIYPENKIVVPYGKEDEGLHLLAAYDKDGDEFTYQVLKTMCDINHWPLVKRYDYTHISEMLEEVKTMPSTREGFVLRFSDGTRIKIKGEEYKRIHKLVSRVTPLAIWELIFNEDDIEKIRADLPDEFVQDFDNIVGKLAVKTGNIVDQVRHAYFEVKDFTDKELGLVLHKFPDHIRPFLFPFRKSINCFYEGRTRQTLLRMVRPTGNRLEGYTPSTSMNRIQDEQ